MFDAEPAGQLELLGKNLDETSATFAFWHLASLAHFFIEHHVAQLAFAAQNLDADLRRLKVFCEAKRAIENKKISERKPRKMSDNLIFNQARHWRLNTFIAM